MKQIGRLLSVVTWLLVVGSVVVLAGGLFGRPLLLAAVPTGSMVPALNPGDMIVILPNWSVTTPGLDDIIVFRTSRDTDWVVHRIFDGDAAEGFITKGDANPIADPVRVFQGDITGVVPQWQGGALRLPRFGLLSLSQGPLSSPIVAGIALVMGVYLLALDMKPAIFMVRMGLKKTVRRAWPQAIVSLYLGLAATAFLTTLIPAWSLSSKQRIQYTVTEQKQSNVNVAGLYILGQPHYEQVPVSNPSPLPILVVFAPEDPNLRYDPPWALIPPKDTLSFRATIITPTPGEFSSDVRMGVFLPLFPGGILHVVGHRSVPLAAVMTALVPAAAILAIAVMDHRSRLVLNRVRMQVWARLAP